MARFFYSDSVANFLTRSAEEILGVINATALATSEAAQQNAWLGQVNILQSELLPFGGRGNIFFEFSVPRIGKRIDVVLVLDGVIFVLEFKVGEDQYRRSAIEQVWDYALDLKNFHDTSHDAFIAPVLVATAATSQQVAPQFSARDDNVLMPICVAPVQLGFALGRVLALGRGVASDATAWQEGRYRPTPTIIEAARALYVGHSVEAIAARGAELRTFAKRPMP